MISLLEGQGMIAYDTKGVEEVQNYQKVDYFIFAQILKVSISSNLNLFMTH